MRTLPLDRRVTRVVVLMLLILQGMAGVTAAVAAAAHEVTTTQHCAGIESADDCGCCGAEGSIGPGCVALCAAAVPSTTLAWVPAMLGDAYFASAPVPIDGSVYPPLNPPPIA